MTASFDPTAEIFDLLVIGGGSAGLTAAGGAAMFGLRVALIEAGEMGGECLNTGCIPSKALIAAAARAAEGLSATRLGVTLGEPRVDWQSVRAHIDGAIAAIAPEDSQERFEALGVEVIRTRARFLDHTTVLTGNRRLRAPRIVIATGSRPRLPDLPGLTDIPFLTNESLFALDTLPEHLVILGGGPIGCEMAQAFRRLGSRVTVIAPEPPLSHDDREAVALVVAQLAGEGVRFEERGATHVEAAGPRLIVTLDGGGQLIATHLLVATGRQPQIDELDLAAAGVASGTDGIIVDARRRTSNRRIYAIGDCRSGPRFTHAAGYEGSLVALDVSLGWRGKVDWRALPRVTYTDPELAQIGLTSAEAGERYGAVEIIRQDFAHNDRAVAEGDTRGFLKMVLHRGRAIGVTIVAARAGEQLLPWAQAITGKSSLFALGSAVIAYPTRAEIAKAAAFTALAPRVFGRWPQRWARMVARGRAWRL